MAAVRVVQEEREKEHLVNSLPIKPFKWSWKKGKKKKKKKT
jgi:hypothetical protein